MDRIIKKSGFTLAELLIVVAIIGVLVAVSVPIFTNQLKKARLATNKANARAAYAAAMAWYMDNCNTDVQQTFKDVGTYDVATGQFVPGRPDPNCEPTPHDHTLDLNIANWKDNYPIQNQGLKNCLGDKVFTKWDVNWNQDPIFDGKISSLTPYVYPQ